MFSKKTCTLQEKNDCSTSDDVIQSEGNNSTTTVIGEGTFVEGNILRGMNADIYGELVGDITMLAGTVRVMQGGKVNGIVKAAGIVVSGEVEGCCEGKCVTVLAQGVLRGICRSEEFSIVPSGVFIGTSETLQKSSIKSGADTDTFISIEADKILSPELLTDRLSGNDSI
ncbi:polymer-forming cytoskeletal protein [Salmonella enterica subsp. enterica serovar Hull]|uniref:Polymer-forming cytoskeletal protein n=1 Tax=Salmonella enterica subsp. enterica serovar Hull TaxID=1403564 RepID=A0A5X4PM52_SALET|nr:polymer-forming cytoskeletal protein [Salmonella enterica subsp. enterica serovar Putten]EBZ7588765.1 polymer-forming cytoskeletal protein [Salmonella enterica subsp. enterica serovar Hull]EBZ8651191.1 polymer-forming cytoskeletal protein [Salmonella enterica subsp. enterica serovar Hull]EEB7450863.1 hypothetical protein [Salmonella enterica subsp. enterica serovar Emek]